jgi:hypothetical protein
MSDEFDDYDDPDPVAKALGDIAHALRRLGNADAGTPMGAVESLGKVLIDASSSHAQGLSEIAMAIENVGAGLEAIARAITNT